MKTRARTQDDKELKKRKLLDAAKELFYLQGYGGTTISQITDRAGESTGTFYLYFASKTELYRALTIEGMGFLKESVEAALQNETGDAAFQLAAVARSYFSFYLEHRDYFCIIAFLHLGQEEFRKDTALLEAVMSETRAIVGIIERVIRRGQEDGLFGEIDPSAVTTVLWGMMDGLFLLDQRGVAEIMGLSLEVMVASALQLVLKGLG